MTVEPITPPPSPVFDLLTTLAECLCAQIVADGSPEPCFCGVVPGDSVPAQYGGDCDYKCGMAWVRLASMYPAASLGTPSELPGNCSASLGFDVEVGIIRCTSLGTAEDLPSAGEMLGTAELQVRDAMTIWRAVSCCPAITSKDYRMSTYQPAGPLGGMVGGSYMVQLVV